MSSGDGDDKDGAEELAADGTEAINPDIILSPPALHAKRKNQRATDSTKNLEF